MIPQTLEDVPDLVPDPKSGVLISAGGRDKGPNVGKRLVHDTEIMEVSYEQEKRPQAVSRIVDTLSSLHRAKTILDAPYVAGKRFQEAFDRAALEKCAGMRFDGLPGGNSSDPSRPQAVIDARREVFDAMDALGGYKSSCGIAAFWIIGMRWSIRQVAEREPVKRVHVWTGVLMGSLDVLDAFYEQRDNRSRRR